MFIYIVGNINHALGGYWPLPLYVSVCEHVVSPGRAVQISDEIYFNNLHGLRADKLYVSYTPNGYVISATVIEQGSRLYNHIEAFPLRDFIVDIPFVSCPMPELHGIRVDQPIPRCNPSGSLFQDPIFERPTVEILSEDSTTEEESPIEERRLTRSNPEVSKKSPKKKYQKYQKKPRRRVMAKMSQMSPSYIPPGFPGASENVSHVNYYPNCVEYLYE